MCSNHIFAGTAAALYHQERTGQGQLVELTLVTAGVYAALTHLSFIEAFPPLADCFFPNPGESARNLRLRMLIASANSYKTSDGFWVQLLGFDAPRKLPGLQAALGIKCKSKVKKIGLLIFNLLFSGESNLIRKLTPMFTALCTDIDTAIGAMTYGEFKDLAKEHDIWWSPIRMPEQVLGWNQAHEIGAFEQHGGQRILTIPVNFHSVRNPAQSRNPATQGVEV